jgi:Rieske Fe-S protein
MTDEHTAEPTGGPDRRTVLRGTAALGLAAAAGLPLSGCGGGSSQVAGDVPAAAPVPAQPAPSGVPRAKSQLYRRGEGDVALTEPMPTRTGQPPAKRTGAAPGAEPAVEAPAESATETVAPSKNDGLTTARRREAPTGSAAPLGRTDEIPVGGGQVFKRHQLVVTQPTAGEYRGFDATCTHQGCIVADCSGGTINCRCHGSTFSLTDGSVVRGPAKQPLRPRTIEVVDGEIRPA